jgi:hypothetical protein
MMRNTLHLTSAAEADGNIPELADLLAASFMLASVPKSSRYSATHHCGSIG